MATRIRRANEVKSFCVKIFLFTSQNLASVKYKLTQIVCTELTRQRTKGMMGQVGFSQQGLPISSPDLKMPKKRKIQSKLQRRFFGPDYQPHSKSGCKKSVQSRNLKYWIMPEPFIPRPRGSQALGTRLGQHIASLMAIVRGQSEICA